MKKYFKKFYLYIRNPKRFILNIMSKYNGGIFKLLSDEKYLKLRYRLIMQSKLNLKNPKTFNEKMQWLKLYDRKPEYTKMVDKYEAKGYIKRKVGESYIIPTYGIYNRFKDINFDKLPNKFIIKCTHDSGGTIICTNKKDFNKNIASKKIRKLLKHNFYYLGREWPYKNVKPRVIVEKLLENKDKSELKEYNFFCFNGEPKLVAVCFGDKKGVRYNDFYDIDFNKLDIKCEYDVSDEIEEKPKEYEQMLKISKKLSKNIPELRVDLYLCDEKIYVGELTFFHWSGFGRFKPEKWDYELGKLIKINSKIKS